MKTLLTTILAMTIAVAAIAQKQQIQSLESTLPKKTDIEFIEDAMALSGLYFNEKMFEMAARRADEAYKKASDLKQKGLASIALNKKGKALSKMANGKRNILNRAFKSFQESNKFSSDDKLKKDNLQNMKTLAERLGKQKELARIEYNLAVLRGENPPPLAEEQRKGIFNKKKKALQEYQRVTAEKENLATEKQNLADELTELSEEQAGMREQQETLIGLLAMKETAIQDMSDDQVKQQLLLSEQERLLDSLTFTSILDSMEISQKEVLVQQQESALREQEAELQLQKSQRNLLLAVAGIIVIMAGGLYHRFQVISKHNAVLAEKNKIIEEERMRSEELLLNILPKAVADELKKSGGAETQYYKQATVLFADFKGFSKISKRLTPQQLVSDLDHAFRHFDGIIEKYGLEKIKTIGDAYMCAGGLPNEDELHPVNVIKAAMEMQVFLKKWNAGKAENGEPVFEARIGIHTGPLVAGVVGSKKFAYDIWGDTVNVASRMETSCEAGRVNISNATFSKIKNEFDCEYRGKVPAKNVGEVEMYYLKEMA